MTHRRLLGQAELQGLEAALHEPRSGKDANTVSLLQQLKGAVQLQQARHAAAAPDPSLLEQLKGAVQLRQAMRAAAPYDFSLLQQLEGAVQLRQAMHTAAAPDQGSAAAVESVAASGQRDPEPQQPPREFVCAMTKVVMTEPVLLVEVRCLLPEQGHRQCMAQLCGKASSRGPEGPLWAPSQHLCHRPQPCARTRSL